jgi:hypothetical protein
MMRPGTILPDFLMDDLQFNEEQRTALAKLQATVDAELADILTEEQQQMLKEIGQRGPEPFPGGRRFEGQDRPPRDGRPGREGPPEDRPPSEGPGL